MITAVLWTPFAILLGFVFAYAVWAARDVQLRRIRADERMDAVEALLEKREKALNKYVETVTDKVSTFDERIQKLEGKRVGAHVASAQGWKP